MKIRLWIVGWMVVIGLLGGCGGGGDSDTPDTGPTSQKTFTLDTPLEAVADVRSAAVVRAFSDIGIETPRDLAARLEKDSPMTLLMALKQRDGDIQSEEMTNFLKKVELALLFPSDSGIRARGVSPGGTAEEALSAELARALARLDVTYAQARETLLRPFRAADRSPEAARAFYESQAARFNEYLGRYGLPAMDPDRFEAAVALVQRKKPLFDHYATALQNVEVETETGPATRALEAVSYRLVNPVDEEKSAVAVRPETYLATPANRYRVCRGLPASFPVAVTRHGGLTPVQSQVTIQNPLMGEGERGAYFQINRLGLVSLEVVNRKTAPASFTLWHDGRALFQRTLEAGERVLVALPVLEKDLCVPYSVGADDGTFAVRILARHEPKPLAESFDETSARHRLDGAVGGVTDDALYREGGVVAFSLYQGVGDRRRTIRIDNRGGAADLLLVAPDGALTLHYAPEGTTEIEVSTQPGKWFLYAMPTDSGRAMLDDEGTRLRVLGSVKSLSDAANDAAILVSIDTQKVHLKRFVVAELKEVALAQNGERAAGNGGELYIRTRTNMAPKLDIPAENISLFSDPAYPVVRCWQKNGRSLRLFDEGGACADMAEAYEALLGRYYRELWLDESDETDDYEAPTLSWRNYYTPDQQRRILYHYAIDFAQRMADERYANTFEIEASLYDYWLANFVQVNEDRFPMVGHYAVYDHLLKDGDWASPGGGGLVEGLFVHFIPRVPVNMPVFAVTKERLARTTLPLGFHYTAMEDDEVDEGAKALAMAKFVVNEALALGNLNFVSAVCNTVGVMKEFRAIELEGDDDPLGEADFFLNRLSSSDTFYGLENGGEMDFGISGVADVPTRYTTYDRSLDYASIACSVAGAVESGVSLFRSTGALLAGDLSGENLDAIESSMLEGIDEGSEEARNIAQAFDDLRNGTVPGGVDVMLKKAVILEALINGVDLYKSLADVDRRIGGLGGRGDNLVRSNAYFAFGSFDDPKSRARIAVKEVDALPVKRIEVALERITVYNNMEASGPGEITAAARIGVVADRLPESYLAAHPFLNGSDGYRTRENLPYADYATVYRSDDRVGDGEDFDLAEEEKILYRRELPAGSNVAAIFFELDLIDDDGPGTIDDDMVGVLSETFYLEDLFNRRDDARVEKIDAHTYRLTVSRPMYAGRELATDISLLDAQEAEVQRRHNRERLDRPSATVTFHIDVTLGDFVDHPEVDTSIETSATGKKAIDLADLSPKEVDHLGIPGIQILDLWQRKALIYDDNETLHVVRVEANATLEESGYVNGENIHTSYRQLFRPIRTRWDSGIDAVWVDGNHLAVFRPDNDKGIPAGIVVMTVPTGHGPTTVERSLSLAGTGAAKMVAVRKDETSIWAVVSFVDHESATKRSRLGLYRIDADTIEKIVDVDAEDMVSDMTAFDDGVVVLTQKLRRYEGETGGTRWFSWRYFDYQIRYYDVTDAGLRLVSREKEIPYFHDMEVSVPPATRSGLLRPFDKDARGPSVAYSRKLYPLTPRTDGYDLGTSVRMTSDLGRWSYANPTYRYCLSADPFVAAAEPKWGARTRHFETEDIVEGVRHAYMKDLRFVDGEFVLALSGVYDDSGFSRRVSLVDMRYDGTPAIESPMFGERVVLEHANAFKASVPFRIDLNGTAMEEYDVRFRMIDEANGTTLFVGRDTAVENINHPETFWYRAKMRCAADGQCRIDLTYDKPCTTVLHRFEVLVSRRGYTAEARFEVQLKETVPYLGEPKTIVIPRIADANRYDTLHAYLRSYDTLHDDPNSCVRRYTVEGMPAWMEKGESYGDRLALELSGTPALGDDGTYDLTIRAYNDETNATVRWRVIVAAPDLDPDPVGPLRFTDVPLSSTVEGRVRITGIDAPVPVRIEKGEYSLDDGNTWRSDESETTAGEIRLRHLSADTYSKSVRTILRVGGMEVLFESVTMPDPASTDDTPDPFQFTDLSDVPLSTFQQAEIVVSGITIPSTLTIRNGEYSLDGGVSWHTESGEVENGDRVMVRHMSASDYDTAVDTNVTIGGVSDTFTSVTERLRPPHIHLPAGAATVYEADEPIDLTLQNDGGPATAWEAEGLPDGLLFDEEKGRLSGSVATEGDYEIPVKATNEAGESLLTLSLQIRGTEAPVLECPTLYTLDVERFEIGFADDEGWRDRITSVQVVVDYGETVDLARDDDYRLAAGSLTLLVDGANRVPTRQGMWEVRVLADGYEAATCQAYVEAASLDPEETNATFALHDAPFSPAHKSEVVFTAKDRFGQPLPFEPVRFRFVAVDRAAGWTEPYRLVGPDGVEHLARPTPLHPLVDGNFTFEADENGTFRIGVMVPGGVDLHDGFELHIASESGEAIGSYTYTHESSTVVRQEWTHWYDLSSLGTDENGSLRYEPEGSSYGYFRSPAARGVSDDNGTFYLVMGVRDLQRSYFALDNKVSGLLLAALDDNGVARWTRRIDAGEGGRFLTGPVVYDDGKLYVALAADGNFSERSEEANSGAYDAALLVVSADDGSVITRRQWGDGRDRAPVAIALEEGGVRLYMNEAGDGAVTRTVLFPASGEAPYDAGAYDTLYAYLTPVGDGSMAALFNTQLQAYEGIDMAWSAEHDGLAPGADDYNYPAMQGVTVDENGFFVLGTAKNRFFGDDFPADGVDYAVVTRRTRQGGYLWSHAFQERVEGTSMPVSAKDTTEGVYVLYHAPEPCPGMEERECHGMRLGFLDRESGEAVLAPHRWAANAEYVGSTLYLRRVEGIDLVTDAGRNVLYVLAWFDGRVGHQEDAHGKRRILLSRRIRETLPRAPLPDSGFERLEPTGIVRDYAQGLQWLDVQLFTAGWDGTMEACAMRNTIDGGGWRVPTGAELQGIVRSDAPHFYDAFAVRNDDRIYWSSDEADADHGIGADFANGSVDAYDKADDGYVRCVRSVR